MVDLHVGVCDCLHFGSLGNKTLGHVIFNVKLIDTFKQPKLKFWSFVYYLGMFVQVKRLTIPIEVMNERWLYNYIVPLPFSFYDECFLVEISNLYSLQTHTHVHSTNVYWQLYRGSFSRGRDQGVHFWGVVIVGVIYGTPLNLDNYISDVSVFHGPKTSSGYNIVVLGGDLIIVEASIIQRCPCIIYSYVVIDLWGEEWFSREKEEEFVEEFEQQWFQIMTWENNMSVFKELDRSLHPLDKIYFLVF